MAVATFAFALGSATPAASKGALPDRFFGTVPVLERPTPAELQLMAQSGVESIRLQISWNAVEPQPGARNWAVLDSIIADVVKAGISPSPVLFGVPTWVSQHPAHPPLQTAEERAGWSRFLIDLAARYGRSGTFWRLHPELPFTPIDAWEIWNEANLRGFWGAKPNPGRYLELLKLSGDSLRLGDPAARVVLGGLFPHPRARYGFLQTRFLNRLYRFPGARDAFDAIAIHPYAPKPGGVLDACLELRRLMNKQHDRPTPIWITELGWTTSGVGLSRSPYRASERVQARRLRRTFGLLIRARGRLRLERLDWYSWRDVPGRLPWTLKMGLLRSDGTPKPSLAAFTRVARG